MAKEQSQIRERQRTNLKEPRRYKVIIYNDDFSTMERIGGCFIDCQFETALFKSMGGKHITYDEYMKLLDCHKA
jgi:hypothetical protein